MYEQIRKNEFWLLSDSVDRLDLPELNQVLSSEQLKILDKYFLKDMKKVFVANGFTENSEWSFYEYRESQCYQNQSISKEERLFCECGKEVKYQYSMISKKTGKVISFSEKHFQDHLHISQNIMKGILKELFQTKIKQIEYIESIIDGEIFQNLFSIKEEMNYWFDEKIDYLIPNNMIERISDFQKVNLPMLPEDQDYLYQLNLKIEYYFRVNQSNLERIDEIMIENKRLVEENEKLQIKLKNYDDLSKKAAQMESQMNKYSPKNEYDPELNSTVIKKINDFYNKNKQFTVEVTVQYIYDYLVSKNYGGVMLLNIVNHLLRKLTKNNEHMYAVIYEDKNIKNNRYRILGNVKIPVTFPNKRQ